MLQVDALLKIAAQLYFKAHGSTAYAQIVVATAPQRLQVFRAGAMGAFVVDGSFDLVLTASAGTVEANILKGYSTRQVITQLVCEGHVVLLNYAPA